MTNIYKESIFSTNIQLRPNEYNQSINETLLEKLKKKVEGKCDKNGFIKPDSADILRRSIGTIQQSQFNGYCSFKVWYKVSCCNPVEGMVVKCSVLNKNKMGIFCELYNHSPSPLTIILAKQHHLRDDRYEEVKVGSSIDVEIVGIKFEYNDTQISCIGRIHNKNKEKDLEDNNEEEYYQEDEEDEDEIMEQEVIIPDVKPSTPKPKSLIDLMTLSEDPTEEEDDVGSGEPESMGTRINEEPGLDLDLEPVDLGSNDEEEEDELELGDDFKGMEMNLEAESEKNRETISLTQEQEDGPIINAKVYQFIIKKKPNDSCYGIAAQPKDKRLKKHFVRYYNYYLLNNMLVDYYNANNGNPSTIYVNTNYKYRDDMIELVKAYLTNMTLEDTDELTHLK